ncbi:MAG: sulfatase-like hydrolase/transferase [Candidatus Acidiferrales bacterium]
MSELGGFARLSRSLNGIAFSIAAWLGLFRADIFVCFLGVPVFLLLLNRFLPSRWGAVATGAISGSVFTLLSIQLRSLDVVGRYVSLGMMKVALGWGLHEAGANLAYLPMRGIIEFAFGLTGIVLATVWAVRSAGHPVSSATQQTVRIGAEAYLLALTIILAAGWRSVLPRTPYHESSLVRAVASLWEGNAIDSGEFTRYEHQAVRGREIFSVPKMTSAELIRRFRDLTHSPAPLTDSPYFRKERGDNVLFFILETTPDEFLPADDDMKQFPNLARLRERSFVGDRHYTTLPMTTAAVFSMFSSWYPDDSFLGIWGFPSTDDVPVFLPRLEKLGYESATFSPVRYHGEQDHWMYRAVGFQEEYVPDQGLTSYQDGSSWRAERKAADLATLHLLEGSMNQWMESKRPFVAAFLPQISHFPYPDNYPANSTENIRNRARALLAVQDSWLGELMDLLQQHGELDKTIIVVVGDHGRRTRLENPNLPRGTIYETSYHVPLLIYAPRTLQRTDRIPWITSHIDIAPTVLDLLGVERDRTLEQGSAIWNPGLKGRTTFLLGQPTFGADGYASDGKFYMWNYLSDSVFENNKASFNLADAVPRDSAAEREVKTEIANLVQLEAAWHDRFCRPASRSSRSTFASVGK